MLNNKGDVSMIYKRGYVFPQDRDVEECDEFNNELINEVRRVYKIDKLEDKYYKVYKDDKYHVLGVKNSKLHGLLKVFNRDGDLVSITQYHDGIRHGMYIKYHENGKTATVGSYINGFAKGSWAFYNEKGELTDETKY